MRIGLESTHMTRLVNRIFPWYYYQNALKCYHSTVDTSGLSSRVDLMSSDMERGALPRT